MELSCHKSIICHAVEIGASLFAMKDRGDRCVGCAGQQPVLCARGGGGCPGVRKGIPGEHCLLPVAACIPPGGPQGPASILPVLSALTGTAVLAAPAWGRAKITEGWKRRCMNLQGDPCTAFAGFPGATCQAGRHPVTDSAYRCSALFLALLHLCKEKRSCCPSLGSYQGCSHWRRFSGSQQVTKKRVRLYCNINRELKRCLKT